jgi:pilus assembly protein Flp/PilA
MWTSISRQFDGSLKVLGKFCGPSFCLAGGNERKEAMSIVRAFLRDEAGATAIEYGLIAAGISVAIIASVQTLGTNLIGTFNSVATALAG